MKAQMETFTLDVVERLQSGLYKVVGPKLGSKAIAFATGSSSEAYTQLAFVPRKTVMGSSIAEWVTPEPARDNAPGLPAKKMKEVVIIGVQRAEVEDCRRNGWQQAVAYRAGGIIRVGHMAMEGQLFGEIDENTLGLGMRQAKKPADFSLIRWYPNHRICVGFNSVEIVDQHIPETELPDHYPGIRLG